MAMALKVTTAHGFKRGVKLNMMRKGRIHRDFSAIFNFHAYFDQKADYPQTNPFSVEILHPTPGRKNVDNLQFYDDQAPINMA